MVSQKLVSMKNLNSDLSITLIHSFFNFFRFSGSVSFAISFVIITCLNEI